MVVVVVFYRWIHWIKHINNEKIPKKMETYTQNQKVILGKEGLENLTPTYSGRKLTSLCRWTAEWGQSGMVKSQILLKGTRKCGEL